MNYLLNKTALQYTFVLFIALILTNLVSEPEANAQYFGRNKPGYRKFQYNVVQTPHFEIYHYLKNDSMIKAFSDRSEKWYDIHQKTFRDTFKIKNPIILYNNHSDFQQTNTVEGMIGTGTGGVTESLKNRVILPIATSLSQTDHVLGHELVHAFQYHLFLKGRSRNEYSMRNLPLWMIEGMAEYLSKGSVDPHTSMIMRDALLNNDFPALSKLSDQSKYFPYTYGQAFWAMVAKTWGESRIVPLLNATAVLGFDKAADTILGYNEKTISGMWKSATELHYSQFLKSKTDSVAGKKIISEKNGGRMNISPSISPDGKYIAFFSERDVFSLDLFLADAKTGKIIKKLSSAVRNNEIDDFNFIESSGTWSPDGEEFAFVIFSKGINKLAIMDVKKGRIVRKYQIEGVPSFSNPAWSPDGSKIVVTGLVEGISDLYLYDLVSGKVEKLTDDFTANLHPAWSSDGKSIVYSQEKMNNPESLKKYSFNVAILDLDTRKINRIDVFNEAFNMNPQFSEDGKDIYFLSDADGFRNMFRYDINSGKVFRLTRFMTGISGITEYSPALSISSKNGLIAYNYYLKDSYIIYVAAEDEFRNEEVSTDLLSYDASTLPPLRYVAKNNVDSTLYKKDFMKAHTAVDSIKELSYKPKFRLDYISDNANVGVSTGLYRNNLGGSVNMIFGDMVGNNQIYASLSLNGEVYDFGGQAAYINQKNKIKWGAALSHIPYRMGSMSVTGDSISYDGESIPVTNLMLDYMRIFEDNISVFGYYPLSQTRRIEASLSASWYNYRIDRFNNYYALNGPLIGGSREKIPAPGGEKFQQVSLAWVSDNSNFGMTSPMNGHRERFQVERYFGDANLYTTLIDYRKYFYVKPFSLAFRLYNYGLYGTGSESNAIPRLYLGNPWLIRGYQNVYYGGEEGGTFDINRLTGSRIALANAEVRFPLSGPERLALIKSKWVFADLNLFFDSGMAWNRNDKVNFYTDANVGAANDISKAPVFSTGASLRINVLGYLIVEPFYAIPLSNGGFRNASFGLNLIPGW
jgi:Tol biopolymer transport system component